MKRIIRYRSGNEHANEKVNFQETFYANIPWLISIWFVAMMWGSAMNLLLTIKDPNGQLIGLIVFAGVLIKALLFCGEPTVIVWRGGE